jgi:hypothetical protein
MFENFSKFFANRENIILFVVALVILSGILYLKKLGLYEGMNQGMNEEKPEKKPSEIIFSPIS